MNKIEQAVANSDLQPLVVEQPTTPVTAAVAAFFAAAAFGYVVGYGLHNLGKVAEEYMSETLSLDSTVDAPTSAQLLAAREAQAW